MRSRRTLVAMAGALAFVLALAPVAFAGNATGVNVAVPGGGKITGVVKAKDGLAGMATTVSAIPSAAGVVHTATTSGTGAFTLVGLVIGQTYVLRISGNATHPEGYYSTNADHFVQQQADSSQTAAVTAGGIAVGNILVAKGLTISGIVKGGTTASSTVQAGVSVRLQGTTSGFATTSASGAYSIGDLPAGAYTLEFDTLDASNFSSGFYQANATGNWTQTAPSTVTLTTANATANVILPAGHTISGNLQNQGGTGIVGGTVTFQPVGFNGMSRSATTGAAGAFVIHGVAPGAGTVAVDPSNGTNLSGFYKSGAAPNFTTFEIQASAVTMAAANVAIGAIKAALPFTVTGLVKNAAGTAGVAGVFVNIGGGSATTDSTGKYVVKVGPGSYEVGVTPYSGNFQTGFFRLGATGSFTANESLASHLLVLGSVAGPTINLPAGFTISGTVHLPSGAPAPYDSVHVYLPCDSSYCFPEKYGSTDSSGVFSITGLSPGVYHVGIDAPYASGAFGGFFDAATATTRLSIDSTAADTKTLSTSATSWAIGVVKLFTGATISGTIKGGAAVLAGATVVACKATSYLSCDPSYDPYAVTSGSGIYTITGLAPGWYQIWVMPKSTQNFEEGYRLAGAAPNFTRSSDLGEMVCTGPNPCPIP